MQSRIPVKSIPKGGFETAPGTGARPIAGAIARTFIDNPVLICYLYHSMKIAIIGAGAMGSLYGGKLSLAGNQVILYDIYQQHVDRINEEGLIIEEAETGKMEVARPKATSTAEEVKNTEIMIIFVKSNATEMAAKTFTKYAGPETIAVTLQNGVGNEEIIRANFGAKRTAAGVTSQGVTFLGPGKIRHAGSGPTHLCMSDKKNAKLAPFVELLNKAGFEAYLEKNIESLIWSKLIINVGINALTAIFGLPNGRLLDFEETKEIMADLVKEAVSITRAKGIELTYDNPLETVMEVAKKTALNRSSMLQDFDKKKATEIDFINGAIVREAVNLGIEVPVNMTVTRLIRTLDAVHAEVPE